MPDINTVKEHIAWSYANLACAHSAIESSARKYGSLNYMIRAKLNRGLVSGTMNMRSTFDDEKIKYRYPESCCYCGSKDNIQMDHLIPQIKGGQDGADNLVWACRSCDSSKRDRDVIVWLESKGWKPSILLLRRYLKLVARYCEQNRLLDLPLTEVAATELPFQIMALPYKRENIHTASFGWNHKKVVMQKRISNDCMQPTHAPLCSVRAADAGRYASNT